MYSKGKFHSFLTIFIQTTNITCKFPLLYQVTDSLQNEDLTEDTKHIEDACSEADTKLTKGPMRLLECGGKVNSTFEASLETFKKTFEACLLARDF